MAWFDFPLETLKTYNPKEKAPKDFDAFWKQSLAETAATGGVDAHFVQVASPFKLVDCYDVTFRGYMGQPIKGWFVLPADRDEEQLPCLVQYVGYTGGRGFLAEHMATPAAGFAVLVMDTRGQGSGWTPGATPDDAPAGSVGPQVGGVMTRGIQSRETYYYRRLFIDAARAVEAAAAHPNVDPARIGVTGGSQGGGIALAAAALAGKKVKICQPDVPFLCHYRRACTIVDSNPYNEIVQYLKAHRCDAEQVFNTLAYFDGMNFASRITARCLFSVGLMDNICPPSTVYAAYNRVKAPKDIMIYDFNNHEGGGPLHTLRRLEHAAKYL